MRSRWLIALPLAFCVVRADAKSYWEGNQINNQSRLGQPFNGFDVEDPARKRDTARDGGYAATIEKARATQAAGNGQGIPVDFGVPGAERFLSVTRLDDGGNRYTLKLELLFKENTAEYRPGSLELLDHLARLLNSMQDKHVQLVFTDDAGDFPGVEELHLERAATVVAYLQFSQDDAAL